MLKPENELRFYSVDSPVQPPYHSHASHHASSLSHSIVCLISSLYRWCCSRQRLSRISPPFLPHFTRHTLNGLLKPRKNSLRWLLLLGVFVITSLVLVYQFWLFGGASSSLSGLGPSLDPPVAVQTRTLSKFKASPKPPDKPLGSNEIDHSSVPGPDRPPPPGPVVTSLVEGKGTGMAESGKKQEKPKIHIPEPTIPALGRRLIGWESIHNETLLAMYYASIPGNSTIMDGPEEIPDKSTAIVVESPPSTGVAASSFADYLPSLAFLSKMFHFPASPAASTQAMTLNFSRITLDDVVDELVSQLTEIIARTMKNKATQGQIRLTLPVPLAIPSIKKTKKPLTDAERAAEAKKERNMKIRINGKRIDVSEESFEPTRGPGVLIPRIKQYQTETVHFIRNGSCLTSDCRALITGHGRSGTHFIAQQLMKNNISIFHEQINSEGSVSWAFAGRLKGKSFVAPKRDMVLLHNDSFSWYPIVFQTRHPLAVIISAARCFCGCGAMSCGKWIDPDSWKWAGNWVNYTNRLPVTTPDGRVLRAMEYFVGWAELVEKQSMWWYQMESVDLQELVDKVGFTGRIVKQEPFKHQRGGTSRNIHNVSWEKMRKLNPVLEAKIWAFAQKYGYGRDQDSHMGKNGVNTISNPITSSTKGFTSATGNNGPQKPSAASQSKRARGSVENTN